MHVVAVGGSLARRPRRRGAVSHSSYISGYLYTPTPSSHLLFTPILRFRASAPAVPPVASGHRPSTGTKHRVGPLGGARLDVAMATNQRAAPLLLSLLSLTDAWRHCEFIHTKWFAHDELPGMSFVYALAAMNGKTYAAGYARGSFGLTGHTRGGTVPPDPTSAFFGDAQSQLQVCQLGLPHAYSPPPASACAVAQSIFISETDATTAKTERGWYMIGAAFPDSEGGGSQFARPSSAAGIKAMLDKRHLAVAGDFGALLMLPDKTTQWSSAVPPRQNTRDAVHFVMKLDVTTANGVGPGTSGWTPSPSLAARLVFHCCAGLSPCSAFAAAGSGRCQSDQGRG